MGKPQCNKYKIEFIPEEEGYSAKLRIGNNIIYAEGDTIDELRTNIIDGVSVTFQIDPSTIEIHEDDLIIW